MSNVLKRCECEFQYENIRTLRFSKSSSFGSKEIAANFEDDDAVIGKIATHDDDDDATNE